VRDHTQANQAWVGAGALPARKLPPGGAPGITGSMQQTADGNYAPEAWALIIQRRNPQGWQATSKSGSSCPSLAHAPCTKSHQTTAADL